jgi:tetratricopeptide (TPR) repeat protein
MASPKIRLFLRELAVATVGAVVAMTTAHWVVSRAAYTWAWATLAVAGQYEKAGDSDRAIVLLSQATATDPSFFGSYELLGDIYSRKGNQRLALEMYEKALEVFDRERFLPSGKISQSEQQSIRSKIDALRKQVSEARRRSTPK